MGYRANLNDVQSLVSPIQWLNFTLIEGDICDLETCQTACTDIDYVLHQAALGSIPRSIDDPLSTNQTNISGFLNILLAARDANIKRMVYAASSSTYGSDQSLPKIENKIGTPLSPYSVTKLVNELYADTFARCYQFESIGLRYFNIFGRRQAHDTAYSAVIPKWIADMKQGKPIYINGDGKTSRDFCYIDNCIQANLLAATTSDKEAVNQIYNVAYGEQTNLITLFSLVKNMINNREKGSLEITPIYRNERLGDIKHTLANIDKIQKLLGYVPSHSLKQGLKILIASK
jgi:UDP-N-acetylglucosamine 4-epimerase